MEQTRFRSSLGGFHRGDVANYIEKTAREHQEQLQQLKDDCIRISTERDAAKAELEQVKAQLEAALEGREMPAAPEGDPAELELAAYRRAEAAERSANARIRRQTEKMDGILVSSAAQFDTAKAQVEDLSLRLTEVLDTLQGSFEATTTEMEKLKKDTEE